MIEIHISVTRFGTLLTSVFILFILLLILLPLLFSFDVTPIIIWNVGNALWTLTWKLRISLIQSIQIQTLFCFVCLRSYFVLLFFQFLFFLFLFFSFALSLCLWIWRIWMANIFSLLHINSFFGLFFFGIYKISTTRNTHKNAWSDNTSNIQACFIYRCIWTVLIISIFSRVEIVTIAIKIYLVIFFWKITFICSIIFWNKINIKLFECFSISV